MDLPLLLRKLTHLFFCVISFKTVLIGQGSRTNGNMNPTGLQACYDKLSLTKTTSRPFIELLSHSIGAGASSNTPTGVGLPLDSSWFSIFVRDMEALQGNVLEEDMWMDFGDPNARNITYDNAKYVASYDGPTAHGIAVLDGFSISFTGKYDYLDFWIKNASIGAKLQFYRDGALYRTITVNTKGIYYTGDGTTTGGNGTSHSWKIKAVCDTVGQSIGLICFNRALIKDYTNNKRPFNFIRCAVPGWNTYTYLPKLDDINTVTGDSANQHGAVIIGLEANDWNNMSPSLYNLYLDSIVKSIISSKNTPFIAYTAKPFPFVAFEGGTQNHLDAYEVYEAISKGIAAKYGIGFVSASTEDFYLEGFMAGYGDVHFSNAGHKRFAEIVETGIANYFKTPSPISLINQFSPNSGPDGTEVIITGINLSSTNSVSFEGVPASSFVVVSSDTVKAIVGKGSSGNVSISTSIGTAYKPNFIYTPQLSINSFTPTSGVAGTIITINGSNFSLNPANNIVTFGTVPAVVTSATLTQLKVIVPLSATYQLISVSVDKHTAYSKLPFVSTYNGGCIFDSTSLSSSTSFNSDLSPSKLVTADLDGDGKLDLISSGGNNSQLTFLKNSSSNASISFADKQYLPIDNFNKSTNIPFGIGDLNADGKPDILSFLPNGIGINVNTSKNGSIIFDSRIVIADNSNTSLNGDLLVGDFDADGQSEIFGCAGNHIFVFKNQSLNNTIAFDNAVMLYPFSGNGIVTACNVVDIDGDGKNDIMASVVYLNEAKIVVFKNKTINGKLTFEAFSVNVSTSVGSIAKSIKSLDVDNDGKPDIVALISSNTNTDSLIVIKNTSTVNNINFAPFISVALGTTANSMSFEDIDGDGKPDIGIASSTNLPVNILINKSTASAIAFAPIVRFGNNAIPFSSDLVIADFNLDGKPDICALQYAQTNANVFVYPNNVCGAKTLQICENGGSSIQSNIRGLTYQWQLNTGLGFNNINGNANFLGAQSETLTLTSIPYSWNNYQLRCIVENNKISSVYTINLLRTVIPTVNINSSTISICKGQSASFAATSTFGGTSPLYQWKVNNLNVGTNDSSYSNSSLNNNDQVQVVLTSNITCPVSPLVVSNVINIAVTDYLVPKVSISTNNTSICATSVATFNAIATDAGNSPFYQWQVNGINTGVNSNTFTSNVLNNKDQVAVILNSSAKCSTSPTATSNIIPMNVINNISASVIISTPFTRVCSGSLVTFTAIATNGGTVPAYQWLVDGTNVGTSTNVFTTNSLRNNNLVQVRLLSNANCTIAPTVVSNPINIAVDNIVNPSIVISGDLSDLYVSTILSAKTSNAASNQILQWQDSTNNHNWQNITGETQPSIAYKQIQIGNRVRCVLTAGNACVSTKTVLSNVLTVEKRGTNGTINHYPNPVVSSLILDDLHISDQWQTVSITNILGQRNLIYQNVSGQTKVIIDTNSLLPGMYVATLVNSNGHLIHFKFVK